MQRPNRFLTTPHQRRRIVLWALVVLAWIAAVLSGRRITARQVRQRGDLSLARLTRTAICLLILRAAEFTPRRPGKPLYWKYGGDLRRAHLIRSVAGSRLRRVLRGRDLATRVARLMGVLRELDRHARHLAKRLGHRMTRLYAIVAAPMAPATIPAMPAFAPALADSS
jgi:hypothetical protein